MDGYVKEKNTVSLYSGDKRVASNLSLMEAFKQALEYRLRGIRVDIVRENLGDS